MNNTSKCLLLGLALILVGLTPQGKKVAAMIYGKALGFTLNNPLNMERGKDKWQGMAKEQTHPRFIKFDDIYSGIRAGFKNLLTYRKRGLNTINKIITTWAPPSDNNPTAAYIANVSSRTGIAPNTVLALSDYPRVIHAMIIQEQGSAVPLEVINEAIKNV